MHRAPRAGCQALKHCPKGDSGTERFSCETSLEKVPNPIHTQPQGVLLLVTAHTNAAKAFIPSPRWERQGAKGGQGARAPEPGWGADLGIEEGYTRTAQKAWSHPHFPPPAPQSSHPRVVNEQMTPKELPDSARAPQPGHAPDRTCAQPIRCKTGFPSRMSQRQKQGSGSRQEPSLSGKSLTIPQLSRSVKRFPVHSAEGHSQSQARWNRPERGPSTAPGPPFLRAIWLRPTATPLRLCCQTPERCYRDTACYQSQDRLGRSTRVWKPHLSLSVKPEFST